MAGMETRLRQGYRVTKAPLGYNHQKVKGEQKIVVNKTGKLIREAFLMKAQQGLSNEVIIKRLKVKGLTIYKQALSRTFVHPFYCGYLVHNFLDEGEVVKGRHEPLVSERIFRPFGFQ
jgi:site-specific DNA recombinase